MTANANPTDDGRGNPREDSSTADKKPPNPGRKQLTAWIAADMHKRMMRLKAEEGIDLKEQLTTALEQYLKDEGY